MQHPDLLVQIALILKEHIFQDGFILLYSQVHRTYSGIPRQLEVRDDISHHLLCRNILVLGAFLHQSML